MDDSRAGAGYSVLVTAGYDAQQELGAHLDWADIDTAPDTASAIMKLREQEYDVVVGDRNTAATGATRHDWDDFVGAAVDATGGRYVDAGQVSYDTAADQVDRIYDDISGCGSCNEQIAYLQEELEQVEEDLAASETWRQLLNHDLRNAINVARGQITLAQETDDDDEYLETAEEHIDRMVRLLERESDARKTQDAQRQQYDTDAQINAIMADCRDEAENAGITLENAADDSYSVTAVSYLQDALGNLVRNGIEHSGADTIWLDAAPADDTEDIIEFHVEDDGDGIPWDTLGIPEHDRKQLFDLGTGSNTGIGLHIVRRAAEESGGYVDVGDAHRAPSGTRFTVAVPRL